MGRGGGWGRETASTRAAGREVFLYPRWATALLVPPFAPGGRRVTQFGETKKGVVSVTHHESRTPKPFFGKCVSLTLPLPRFKGPAAIAHTLVNESSDNCDNYSRPDTIRLGKQAAQILLFSVDRDMFPPLVATSQGAT